LIDIREGNFDAVELHIGNSRCDLAIVGGLAILNIFIGRSIDGKACGLPIDMRITMIQIHFLKGDMGIADGMKAGE
jgi:hypothetical protein